MAFAEIRSRIVGLLKTVDGIGEVHDFRRHTTTWETLLSRGRKDFQFSHWEVTRSAARQALDAVEGLSGVEPWFQDIHDVLIIGRVGLDDERETEKEFQALIDRIVEKIRQNNMLGNVLLLPRSLQVPVISHMMYGGVLVHYCEMTFEAIERVGG